MITSIEIRNFKRLKITEKITIGENVVLLGSNNSGKTTFLQAISLWHLGLMKWIERRSGRTSSRMAGSKRTGVPINRKDILTIPIKQSKTLWSDLVTLQTTRNETGKIKGNKDINIEITVEGILSGKEWKCGLEFEYRDEEVIYVRPLRDVEENAVIKEPELLKDLKVFYLPTMSGLKTTEEKLLPETIAARIGEGRTAEVLRNICYLVCRPETSLQSFQREPKKDWELVKKIFESFFLVKLLEPELDARGELQLYYEDYNRKTFEIISAGRGFQQILLLISCILLNPHSILLIDEPDAHLEILKQREIYNLLKEVARTRRSQLIVATHSEVLMNESSNEDKIVIFYPVDKPRVLETQNNRNILKSLKEYGFENYVLAHRKKFVLYLEGSTDLDTLKSFADVLSHSSRKFLQEVFAFYIGQNDPNLSRRHFTALKDAVHELKGVAIYDKITNPLNKVTDLFEYSWSLREIENYFFKPELFLRWVDSIFQDSDLFQDVEKERQREAMQNAIENVIPKYAMDDRNADYWSNCKASEEMDRIFKFFYRALNKPVEFSKNKYFKLAMLLKPEEVSEEIKHVLDELQSYDINLD
jgi:predicted ATPase